MPLPITALYAALLFAVIELNGASVARLHALGLSLLASRIVHPFGLRVDDMRVRARFEGAFGTLLVMIADGTAGRQALAG